MKRARTPFAAILAAGALASGLVACGGEDDPVAADTVLPPAATTADVATGETESTPPTTESEPAVTASTETEPPETETQPPPEQPPPSATVIRVADGEPIGGPTEISIKSGERLRLVVQSDAPEEVHVHGYDISKPVGPGTPARFSFAADLEGIFEIELENSAVEIATLIVEP